MLFMWIACSLCFVVGVQVPGVEVHDDGAPRQVDSHVPFGAAQERTHPQTSYIIS